MTIVVAGVKMRGGGPGAKVLATGVHPAVKCESEGINISDLVLESTGDCSCVEVCKGSSLTMSGCSIMSVRGSGVEVCGKVTAKECKMTECGQYGVIAREGGSFEGNGISLLSNSKTGLLARGKGSHAVCCKSVMGKNQGNGAGCDGGGHIEVNDSIVSENKLVGIMVGPVGTADVQSTELLGNGMHGVAVNSGSIKAKDTRMIQSRQLGAMVCPPSRSFFLSSCASLPTYLSHSINTCLSSLFPCLIFRESASRCLPHPYIICSSSKRPRLSPAADRERFHQPRPLRSGVKRGTWHPGKKSGHTDNKIMRCQK